MSSGWTRPRAIRPDDDTSQFSSGDYVKDQWLRSMAVANHYGGGSNVYVSLRDGLVAGFYTLSTASVQRADATPRAARSMPDPVPAILLGRLAVDMKDSGRGLGTQLLRDAIVRSLKAAEIVGIRVLLVHAATETARDFYARKAAFEQSPTDPMNLMLMLKDARSIAPPAVWD